MKIYRGFAGSVILVCEKITLKIMVFNEVYSKDDFLSEWLNNIVVSPYGICPIFHGAIVFSQMGLLVHQTFGKSLVECRVGLDYLEQQLEDIYSKLPFVYLDRRLSNLVTNGHEIKLIDYQRVVYTDIYHNHHTFVTDFLQAWIANNSR
jgi:hypothetical protein